MRLNRLKLFGFTLALVGAFFPSSSYASQQSCAEAFTDLSSQIYEARTLRLKSDNGRLEIPGNAIYEQSQFQDLVQYLLSRSPEEQARIDEELTEALGRREMSFAVKNPKTGNYDKIFKVHVNGMPLFLSQKYYNELVQSTAPLMRAVRSLTQKIFSESELTPAKLGLQDLPKREQQQVIDIIKSSIYYEPKLVHPNFKDYPFFSIVGFDAALGRLDKVIAKFFEFNSGTPSGWSNNIQILELLRKNEPELFEKMRPYLAKDNTFKILKETIDDNAKAWTGNDEGISVVVGPGVYNGAHPDVASIAYFSNMPLVQASDLYIDAAGKVRLNSGKMENDPVVTGIYGRVEESFFLQDSHRGYAWKVPDHEDNPELGRKWGVQLEAGVAYQFKYDDNGKKIGVFKDENGKPLLAEAWDKIGLDPTRPDAERGSFAEAIKNKQLYFSGLGGRVVDDKRLFEFLSKYVAPKYGEAGQVIASPPGTIRPVDLGGLDEARKAKVLKAQRDHAKKLQAWNKKWDGGNKQGAPTAPRIEIEPLQKDEMQNFLRNPEKYVVKAPDGSGGQGIYIMPMLDRAEREKVVEMVLKDIESGSYRLTIQEFAEQALFTAVEEVPEQGLRYSQRANDIRLFSVMDSQGNVRAGNNSHLARIAGPQSASTNTSQGAQYGNATVLNPDLPRAQQLKKGESVLPLPTSADSKKPLAHSQILNMVSFASDLQKLIDRLAYDQKTKLRTEELLDQVIVGHRALIDVIGTEHSHYISAIRDFREGKLSPGRLHQKLTQLRETLISQESTYVDGSEHFKAAFIAAKSINRHKGPTIGDVASLETVRGLMKRIKLDEPVRIRSEVSGGMLVDVYEVGRVSESSDPYVADVIKEITAAGGEIRILKEKFRSEDKWLDDAPGAVFRVAEDGTPIIGINFTQPHALAALAHEREHLRMWMELKEEFMSRGKSEVEARRIAFQETSNPYNRLVGEKRSLEAEMDIERSIISELNKGPRLRAQTASDYGYINRMSYPYLESLREYFNRWKLGRLSSKQRNKVKLVMKDMIDNAKRMRAEAVAETEELLKNPQLREMERAYLEQKLKHFKHSLLLTLIMTPYERGQMMNLGVFESFVTMFNRLSGEAPHPVQQQQ